MSGASSGASDLKAVKSRLDEIVQAVNDDAISLDDALALYEEAVELGVRASEIVESALAADAPADDAADVPADAGGAGRQDAGDRGEYAPTGGEAR